MNAACARLPLIRRNSELQSGSTLQQSKLAARMDQLVTGRAKVVFPRALDDNNGHTPSKVDGMRHAPERHTTGRRTAHLGCKLQRINQLSVVFRTRAYVPVQNNSSTSEVIR
jgi:hypothetical protein